MNEDTRTHLATLGKEFATSTDPRLQAIALLADVAIMAIDAGVPIWFIDGWLEAQEELTA